jgi:hypothetical protein
MSLKSFVVCDGCDAEELIARPEGERPPSFKPATVSLNGGSDQKYDLCPSCTRRMAEAVDPKQWVRCPRPAEAA